MTPDDDTAPGERIGSALTRAGMPRLPARVFASLLADDDGRMTAAELGDLLAASAGGISGAVRYLENVSLVRREREPGTRRDVYAVDDDAWFAAMMRHDQVYGPITAALQSALAHPATTDTAARRLRLAREFLVFLEQELDALGERWEAHRRLLDLPE